MDLYIAAIVSGAAVGGTYALMAVGITHVFNVTRVLNFAHAGLVLWGANIYASLTFEREWPVVWAAMAAIAVVTAMGLLSEMLVFRFAERATPVKKAIMTFGLLMVMLAVAVRIYGQEPRAAISLMPRGGFGFLGTRVSWQQGTNLLIAGLVVAGMGVFLQATRRGLLTRAMAEDETVTQLLGVSRGSIARLNWAIASALAGLTGVLIASLGVFFTGQFVFLFFVGLTASLVGGLRSLGLAALGGIAIGVIQNVTTVAWSAIGAGQVAIFVAVVLLVLLRRNWPSEVSNLAWSKPEAEDGSRGWLVGRVALAIGWGALILAVVNDDIWGTTGVTVLIYTLASYSFVPLTGWTGQISLGQGGLMAIGAYTLGEAYIYHELSFGLAIVVVLVVGAFVGTLLGLLTLRLGFVQTAVVTLSFASVVVAWLLFTSFFHTTAGRLAVFAPSYLDTGRSLFVGLGLATLVVLGALWSLRHSHWGTITLAIRTNPDMVRHFGVSPARARVGAFAISGAIAALAGAGLILLISITGPATFGLTLSLTVLLYAVVGGTESLLGPLIGSLVLIALPKALDLTQSGNTTTSDIIAGVAIIYLMTTRWDGLSGMLKRPASSKGGGLARRIRRGSADGDPAPADDGPGSLETAGLTGNSPA